MRQIERQINYFSQKNIGKHRDDHHVVQSKNKSKISKTSIVGVWGKKKEEKREEVW